MAFTLEQNVQGAAAYEKAIQPTSSTGLTLAGNLLEGLDTYARAQVRQDKATAAAAKGTQTDRDRREFGDLLNSARQDLNKGMDPDVVATTYAPRFASLGLNSNQEAVVENTFGSSIFAVPIQPESVSDIGTKLFNDQPESVQLGLIAIELQKANQNGETIDNETAAFRAVSTLVSTTAQAQVALQAGNLDYAQGFQGNMQTLDRLGEAVSAALAVEAIGGNFNLQDLARLRAGYTMLRTQRAFMQPSGTLNAELWGQMNTKLTSLDRLFTAIEDYDSKDATARATAVMANLALSVSQDNPMAILAMNSPEMMEKIAARISPDFATKLVTNGSLLDNIVSYKDLDFDPSIVAMMGFDTEDADTPTVLQTPETVFPANLVESHAETVADPALLTQSVGELRELTEGMSSAPDEVLATPEGREAWTSSVANMSYLLSEAPNPSTENLDSLFSNQNLTILRRMESEGGETAEQATMLRQQMAQALKTSSNKYAITALGQLQQLPAVSIDPETLTIRLSNAPDYQELNSIVNFYYDGDFTKLWREGTFAWLNLRNRLARSGAITPDSPEYETFLVSTAAINPSDPKSIPWRIVASKYSEFSGVTERLQKFRQYEENLNLDTGLQSIVDSSTRAIDEASTDEAAEAREGAISASPLPPMEQVSADDAYGTQDNPWPIAWSEERTDDEELFNTIPLNHWFIDPDGFKRKKLQD